MVSFFAEVKFFRFWTKTMDYSKAFSPSTLITPHWKVLGKLKLVPPCNIQPEMLPEWSVPEQVSDGGGCELHQQR